MRDIGILYTLSIFEKPKLFVENCEVSLSALKLVKNRIINSVKRTIGRLNVNNLLLKLTFSYFHNLLKPRLNHVIK